MENNRIKIISNPYEKQTSFERWNLNLQMWEKIGNENTQYLRCMKTEYRTQPFLLELEGILDSLIEDFSTGKEKVDIEFQGTREEYSGLLFFVRENGYSDRIMIRPSLQYLKNGNLVLHDLEELYENSIPFIKEYNFEFQISEAELEEIDSKLNSTFVDKYEIYNRCQIYKDFFERLKEKNITRLQEEKNSLSEEYKELLESYNVNKKSMIKMMDKLIRDEKFIYGKEYEQFMKDELSSINKKITIKELGNIFNASTDPINEYFEYCCNKNKELLLEASQTYWIEKSKNLQEKVMEAMNQKVDNYFDFSFDEIEFHDENNIVWKPNLKEIYREFNYKLDMNNRHIKNTIQRKHIANFDKWTATYELFLNENMDTMCIKLNENKQEISKIEKRISFINEIESFFEKTNKQLMQIMDWQIVES